MLCIRVWIQNATRFVPRLRIVLVSFSYDVAPENLHQILEEVDVDEMRIFGYTPQGRRQKRCRMGVFEYLEVQDKKKLQGVRVLCHPCQHIGSETLFRHLPSLPALLCLLPLLPRAPHVQSPSFP